MNKTSDIERYRLFLVDKLPEPLTHASSHLQIFDDYLPDTRIRLRKIRDPYSKAWTYWMQQRTVSGDEKSSVRRITEIHLNDAEYGFFERFEHLEIRKNRYFHEFDLYVVAFDVYLGDLSGLTTARVDFKSDLEKENFLVPPFAVFEITNDPFFAGQNLVGKHFEEVRAEVDLIAAGPPRSTDQSDE